MKNGDDFCRGFPQAEEGFRRAMDDALGDLAEKRATQGFRVPRLTVVLAAILLLLSSAAVAATIHRLNIQDFTDRSQRMNLTDEARRILAADFPDVVIDNPYSDMVITEAVYDGMAIYVLVEVTPKIKDTFFIPYGLMDSPNVSAYTYGRSYPTDISKQAYAEQLGYKDVMGVDFWDHMTEEHYYDSSINEDGSISLMWWSRVRPEYQDQPELTVNARVKFEKNGYALNSRECSFVIPRAGEVQRSVSREGESVTFEHAGVHVTGVEAVRTPMSTYIIVNYDIVDREIYGNSFVPKSLRFLNENGEELLPGAYPLSVRVDQPYLGMVGDPFYITNLIFEEMPTEITLGEYEGNWEDSWTEGETYTFHLK